MVRVYILYPIPSDQVSFALPTLLELAVVCLVVSYSPISAGAIHWLIFISQTCSIHWKVSTSAFGCPHGDFTSEPSHVWYSSQHMHVILWLSDLERKIMEKYPTVNWYKIHIFTYINAHGRKCWLPHISILSFSNRTPKLLLGTGPSS